MDDSTRPNNSNAPNDSNDSDDSDGPNDPNDVSSRHNREMSQARPFLTMCAAVVCAVALGPAAVRAQGVPAPLQAPPLPPAGVALPLEQVLDLAEARSETIAIARAAIRRAEGEQV